MNRRSALVGTLASFIIPPAMASTLMRDMPATPMSAKDRADFHMAEFARAMEELMPADAHEWGVSAGAARGGQLWDRRHVTYRIPDPEILERTGDTLIIDRKVYRNGGRS